MNQTKGRAEPLSLQDKLDRISHEREVLAQLRELARRGLHDGDQVVQRSSGAAGRVLVLKDVDAPCCVVELADGGRVPLDGNWVPGPA